MFYDKELLKYITTIKNRLQVKIHIVE